MNRFLIEYATLTIALIIPRRLDYMVGMYFFSHLFNKRKEHEGYHRL